MDYIDEDREKLHAAIKVIKDLEAWATNYKERFVLPIIREDIQVLSWAVVRLTEELEFSKEPLTEQEMEFGRQLGEKIAKREAEKRNTNKEIE